MRDKIIDTMMALLADHEWHDITLGLVASSAGLSMAQVRDAYDDRIEVLADFSRRIDKAVLGNVDAAMADEPVRERLFDIVYSRFEAIEVYRQALGRLARAVTRDPGLAFRLNRNLTSSMAWMLDAAGAGSSGLDGIARAQGLALVWGQVMRVWLTDDDPGHARTMAELDRRLRQAERNMLRLRRLRRLVTCRPRRQGRRQAENAAV
jgi:AcrR family transcriptional regulator